MSEKNIFEERQSKFEEIEELSADNILSESTLSKVKNRKNKLFQKMMSIRTKLLTNINTSKLQNKLNFEQILDKIKNNTDKINIINSIFINNIQKAKEILSKNYIFNYKEEEINPNSESFTNYLLDLIETNAEFAKNNIVLNESNLNCLINRINCMAAEKIDYDSNYIMIKVYFSILDENVNKTLRQKIDHNNLIQLIIKKETCLSYIYLFYIYGFIYYLSNQEIEQYDGILDSIIRALINKKDCKNDKLLWEMYNLLTYFSGIKKFLEKFYNNYEYIFCKRDFYEKDKITIEKLKIINNIFSNMDNKQIFSFLTKENDITLNMIVFWLKFLSEKNHIKKAKDDLNKLNLILLTMKTLSIITSYHDLSFLFLENKRCLHLIIVCLKNFFDLNIKNPQLFYINGNNSLLIDIENILLEIANNIIINGHEEFISLFCKSKAHLLLKDILESFSGNSFNINELLFNNALRIISSLFEYEKIINSNSLAIKSELDNCNLAFIILNIKSNQPNDGIIFNKCNDFINMYYNFNNNNYSDINMC